MNKYAHLSIGDNFHRYQISPGDATQYLFSFYSWDGPMTKQVFSVEPAHRQSENFISGNLASKVAKEPDATAPIYHLVHGIGETGEGWVHISIDMETSQGSYDIDRESLGHVYWYTYDDCCRHMRGVNEYTMAAVLLALSVLVFDPNALEEAGRRMLRAPQLMAKRYKQEDDDEDEE